MNKNKLVEKARKIKENSYCEYSDFNVGAALLTKDGKIFVGVNVENVNFNSTIHAEGNAISNAISKGYGVGDFEAIAVSSKNGAFPCGRCRQTLYEFCEEDLKVIADNGEEYTTKTLSELYPNPLEI